MRLIGLELGPFAARAVIVACERSGRAMVIDPGFEPEAIVTALREGGLEPLALVLTHAHLDHAYGVAALKSAFPAARLLLHADDVPLLRQMDTQASLFGFPAPSAVAEDGLLRDGDELAFGDERLLVRHAPGHSPGHVVLVGQDGGAPVAIVGDVLFAGSVGRTDLWGGSFPDLERSIREVLYTLPPSTRVIPGHGPETTVGEEMASNPFVPASG